MKPVTKIIIKSTQSFNNTSNMFKALLKQVLVMNKKFLKHCKSVSYSHFNILLKAEKEAKFYVIE